MPCSGRALTESRLGALPGILPVRMRSDCSRAPRPDSAELADASLSTERSVVSSDVLSGSALETGTLSLKRPRKARVTFVSAKVTKTMVPAGWPAAATPRQVPVSDAVLGARANRPSLAWSPSLDFLSRDPCARHPSRPPSKGTDRSGSPLRGIAEIWSCLLAAMSRSDEPFRSPSPLHHRRSAGRAQGAGGHGWPPEHCAAWMPLNATPSTAGAEGTGPSGPAVMSGRGLLLTLLSRYRRVSRAVLKRTIDSAAVSGRGTPEHAPFQGERTRAQADVSCSPTSCPHAAA